MPVSPEEQQRIDAWIAAKGLNEFGDEQGTMYLGGTPLFDERTGQTVDKYDYIVGSKPERPWNQQ